MLTSQHKTDILAIIRSYHRNNVITREAIVNEIASILMRLRMNCIINDFNVVCDESNNTIDDILCHMINVQVLIKSANKYTVTHYNFNERLLSTLNVDHTTLDDIQW